MLPRLFPVLCFLLSLLAAGTARAQDYAITAGGTVTACQGTFTDGGGRTGGHGPSGTRQVITFCSDGSGAGTHLQLTFEQLQLAGTLTLYDGTTTNAAVLAELSAAQNGETPVIAASAANRSGCITAEFRSSGDAAGWVARLACVTACQPIVAELAAIVPPPSASGYLDLCAGEPITLTGRGRYPQAGSVYPQSDVSSSFLWTFGNGDTLRGRNVTYAYEAAGGYDINLTITDAEGCTNTNRIGQRVRVAPPPIFAPAPPPPLVRCPGEAVSLTTRPDSTNPYGLRPVARSITYEQSESFSETISIPDNLNTIYSSALDIQSFEPGQRLTDGSGIESICVTIEHSYLGDLDMWVACPDGNRLTLLSDEETTVAPLNVRFGYGTKEVTTPEPAETYCWTADATQNVYEVGRTLRQTPQGRPVLPFDTTYLPMDGDFASLVGCNLNGRWTLNARDNYADDDGTIYGWTINFGPGVLPAQQNFTIPIGPAEWSDNGELAYHSADSVVYRAGDPGFHQQRLSVTDSLGCTYDTLMRIDIASPFAADCFVCPAPDSVPLLDTTLCIGNDFVPDLPLSIDTATQVRWRAFEDRMLTGSDTSTLTITDQVPAVISDITYDLGNLCVDYTAVGDLRQTEIRLRSPDGTRVVLAARGTLTGSSLQRCFTPEGDSWNALTGSDTNGDWVLEIDDAATNAAGGMLTEWSLVLVRRPRITYRWSPASPDFSCTDCRNPVIRPGRPGTYTLTATSSDGCTASSQLRFGLDSLVLGFADNLVGGCAGADNGSITLAPDTAINNLSYNWNTGDTTLNITNLAPGTYSLTVSEAGGCSRIYDYVLPAPDTLAFAVDSIVPPACFGTATGQVYTSIGNGAPPYTYEWSPGVAQSNGAFAGAVPAGQHAVTITDANGCSSRRVFTVQELEPLAVALVTQDPGCGGSATGELRAVISGGSPPYSSQWEGFVPGPVITGLVEGTYVLDVTDANGCRLMDTVTLQAPKPLEVTGIVSEIGCFGSEGGAIAVIATGGREPYTFSWGDGAAGASRESLSTGTYTLTVTDAGGCRDTSSFELRSSGELSFTVDVTAPVCPGESTGRIVVTAGGGVPPLLYSIDGVAFVNANRFDNLTGGTYTIYLRDALGCSQQAEVVLPGAPPFSVDLGPDTELVYGDSLRFAPEIVGGAPPLRYQWMAPESGVLSCIDCPDPLVRPEYEGTYSLTVIDSLGCSAEDQRRINIRKIRALAVPTGFTPDGDGHNDLLRVHGRPGTRVVRFTVFDRWGGQVYEAEDFPVNDANAGWDGNDAAGRELDGGVYLYKLTVEFEDGLRTTTAGQTTLIR
ncbi:proprotein convertase P-domain-containing protein [Lewinella sp. IMCC34183]|uniref:proprotein convertase P-domain-containing protein n=1 Tax=Lewinella sp. IMCC34183 TaxID=2248762 RepID=UPI0018E4EFEA|nr:proprotein convertase P-domain-containing protein [Lewinella sp. IMCC34183]